MKKKLHIVIAYLAVFGAVITLTVSGNRFVTVMHERQPFTNRRCVIIDAGHGGVDGGATSCSGVLESQINLEIALRLDDLMHLLGIDTLMIRTDDRSVYTEGQSIAAKKISDLKERVRIVNSTDEAVLVSIHQNHFTDNRYHGAQVFYGEGQGSSELASVLQHNLVMNLNPNSTRNTKQADGIYLLEKVNCTAVLVECGFISNPEEEAKLRSTDYQQKLCCVIAATVSHYLSNT